MEILYEDRHVLALVKPAGLLTQKTDLEEDSLENRAALMIKERDHKPGNAYCFPIHRLDRPVRGIVLFAKSSKALSRLNESMRKGEINKRYRAWIEGKLPKQSGELTHFLEKEEYRTRVSPQGKESRLSYQVLEDGSVDIALHTGRYHQIRAQMSAVGCPIVGDAKYGAKTPYKEGIALCHYSLSFPHPITKERIEVAIIPFPS